MTFKRQFQKKYKGHEGVKNKGISATIPDMNLTLKELLHNHTRGITSDVKHHEGQYFEEQEIPEILDLNDLTELQNENKKKDAETAQKIKSATTLPKTPTKEPLPVPVPEPKPPVKKTVPEPQPKTE